MNAAASDSGSPPADDQEVPGSVGKSVSHDSGTFSEMCRRAPRRVLLMRVAGIVASEQDDGLRWPVRHRIVFSAAIIIPLALATAQLVAEPTVPRAVTAGWMLYFFALNLFAVFVALVSWKFVAGSSREIDHLLGTRENRSAIHQRFERSARFSVQVPVSVLGIIAAVIPLAFAHQIPAVNTHVEIGMSSYIGVAITGGIVW